MITAKLGLVAAITTIGTALASPASAREPARVRYERVARYEHGRREENMREWGRRHYEPGVRYPVAAPRGPLYLPYAPRWW